ncbi:alpha/beta hydrolase [Microbacterium sp. kSW2-24]|uniref:alpha/beta fold hydrolase n=1 Tax=Microbacterium galbinum TaxID=2851646 RepID=UPI001FFD6DA1|nr:alpha/beta hydrolase [Microbacterium galbinum]MCK2023954.1 alpha/beta hydrolase [Microbacterium galbinum]
MTAERCTVFVLPGLGLDARSALPLQAELDERFRVVAVELPGQGSAPDASEGSVAAQVDAALAMIREAADGGPWMLCGHSMGGKVAAAVAARIRDGEPGIFGLLGTVLLAPSPPSPEPMPAEKRRQMLSWVAEDGISESDAQTFVDDNVGAVLPPERQRETVDAVARMSPLAWRRWLEEGSVEDITASVGTLDLPCRVLAGVEDEALGADAQPDLLADVYPRARFIALPGAGHLLLQERPGEVAAAITELWEEIAEHSVRVPAEWGTLLASPRVSARVRSTLARRALPDDPAYRPRVLSSGQLELLRAVAARVVPQPPGGSIDLAARVDADLAAGGGDGWRPAGALPDDEAYRAGLDQLARVWPEGAEARDGVLREVIAGTAIPGITADADDLRRWFEDVRVDLVREWLCHPASLARVGYDGFATGAEEVSFAGYLALGAGLRDGWEPSDLGAVVDETEGAA